MANKFKSERYNYGEDSNGNKYYFDGMNTEWMEAYYNGYITEKTKFDLDENRFVKTSYTFNTDDDCWIFYGKTINDNWFIMEDDGTLYILDSNPRDSIDDYWTDWWKEEHVLSEVFGDERNMFIYEIMKNTKTTPKRNGFDINIKDHYSGSYGISEHDYSESLANLQEHNCMYRFAY